MEYTIPYNTRDAKGNNILKKIKIKQYPKHNVEFCCPTCKQNVTTGARTKDIVSANFTDWAYIGDYVCEKCADLFSLYFYNYIIDPDGIHLYNVRELRDQLTRQQKTPFLFCITTSQKKHLFYKACWNYGTDSFAVNLETETIYTTPRRMKELFDFVECMMTLGCTKDAMKQGVVFFEAAKKVGFPVIEYLQRELEQSREIQIPLYCGQKREITEEDAICAINLILTT